MKLDQLQLNSKNITSGGVFVCTQFQDLEKTKKYLADAISRDAKILVSPYSLDELNMSELQNNSSLFSYICEDPWRYIENFIKKYVNFPKNIYGVTGTNGKSSVVDFISQLFYLSQNTSASIGTVGVYLNNNFYSKTRLTTEDLVTNYNLLDNIHNQADHVAIEASSHGLHQNRLFGINFEIGIFTSFAEDHINYHGNMENYLQAKMGIIDMSKKMIICSGIEESIYQKIINYCEIKEVPYLTYGYKENDTLYIKSIKHKEFELTEVDIIYNNIEYRFFTKIGFDYMVENICAALLTCSQYQHIQLLIDNIHKVSSPIGRNEIYKLRDFNNSYLLIDYAHNGPALKALLEGVCKMNKQLNPKFKITLLFGCSNSNPERRKAMSEIAVKYANSVIVTDDNPGAEDATKIRKEIWQYLEMFDNTQNLDIHNIANREIAIEYVLNNVQDNEIVILAGKGHENYQIIEQGKYIDFDEREIIKKYIS